MSWFDKKIIFKGKLQRHGNVQNQQYRIWIHEFEQFGKDACILLDIREAALKGLATKIEELKVRGLSLDDLDGREITIEIK